MVNINPLLTPAIEAYFIALIYLNTTTSCLSLAALCSFLSHDSLNRLLHLNNMVEQDHRRVKQRIYPMLGFKRLENAAVTISGIGLIHRIRKGQFNTPDIDVKEGRRHELWQSVLAA